MSEGKVKHETDAMSFELIKGDDYVPTRLKCKFKQTWNFAFKMWRNFAPPMTEEEYTKLEIREAVRHFVHGLEREIYDNLPEKWKW